MIEYLPQALSSLQSATQIVSTLLSLRDFSKHAGDLIQLQSHIIKANEMIISTQNQHSSLMARIHDLEYECMHLKDWGAEKKHYSCKQIAPGVFAYITNSFAGQFQDAHKLCCNCFDKSIRSTLQQNHEKRERRLIKLVCPNGCPEIIFSHYLHPE